MIDLHTHTFFSDGLLGPAELITRAQNAGYKVIALTDHTDISNIDVSLPNIIKVCEEFNKLHGIKCIPGVELTYVPLNKIKGMVQYARKTGAKIVVVHGETRAEPVPEGTNKAAIEAGCDILAHPGFISADEMKLAAEKGVYIEITTRKGHNITNGYVAALAQKYKNKLVLNTDTHAPGDLLDVKKITDTILGSGLKEEYITQMYKNSYELAEKCGI